MNCSALIMAIIITGIVWGGLSFFLMKAIKFEKNKKNIDK